MPGLLLLVACSPGAATRSEQPSDLHGRCDPSLLDMKLIGLGAATGNVRANIELRNISSSACEMYGYASLELLDAAYRPLPSHISQRTTAFFQHDPAAADVVVLPIGTAKIVPGRPVQGHAYIPLGFADMGDPCESVVRLRVMPPGASSSVVIGAADPGGAGYVSICSGGAVTVLPVRATPY